jgi:nitroreductase
VLACTERLLEQNERYRLEVLGSILPLYRQSISPLQTYRAQQIDNACQALQQRPIDLVLLEALAKALNDWVSLCRPLILFDVHQGRDLQEFEIPAENVRLLLAQLAVHHHYDVALQIAHLANDVFRPMPATIEQLNEDVDLIESLSLQTKLTPLQDVIERLEGEPGPLIAALQKDGFGRKSLEPAQSLWDTFLQALHATESTKPVEPWRFVRNLAMRLGRNVGSSAAAASIVLGLIQHGEAVSAAPEILDALRADLITIKPVRNAKPARLPSKAKRIPKAAVSVFAGVVVAAALGAFALYRGFDKLPRSWLHSIEMASTTPEAEIIPAVGTGQHLSLGSVRYCHYQEERLRIIQREAHTPEDVRAFNLLAVDYNSRCSDFFYQDSDLKTVLAEVAANRKRLEADAKQIMASWPGHGSPGARGSSK